MKTINKLKKPVLCGRESGCSKKPGFSLKPGSLAGENGLLEGNVYVLNAISAG
jgi:hypothetical protein